MTILNKKEERILNKIGDALIPANNGFPSFSETGCSKYADEILAYMKPSDMEDLKLLFKVSGILPKFGIRWFIKFTQQARFFPNFIAKELRFIDFGVKGLVMTLYYSSKTGEEYAGKSVNEILGYEVFCEAD